MEKIGFWIIAICTKHDVQKLIGITDDLSTYCTVKNLYDSCSIASQVHGFGDNRSFLNDHNVMSIVKKFGKGHDDIIYSLKSFI